MFLWQPNPHCFAREIYCCFAREIHLKFNVQSARPPLLSLQLESSGNRESERISEMENTRKKKLYWKVKKKRIIENIVSKKRFTLRGKDENINNRGSHLDGKRYWWDVFFFKLWNDILIESFYVSTDTSETKGIGTIYCHYLQSLYGAIKLLIRQ